MAIAVAPPQELGLAAPEFGVDDLLAGLEAALCTGVGGAREAGEATAATAGLEAAAVASPGRSVGFSRTPIVPAHIHPPTGVAAASQRLRGQHQSLQSRVLSNRAMHTREVGSHPAHLVTASLSSGSRCEAPARPTESCTICFDELSGEASWRCMVVPGHTACNACMFLHIRALLNDRGVVPACPILGCNHILSGHEVRTVIEMRSPALGILEEDAAVLVARDQLLRKKLRMARQGAFPCIRGACEGWIVPKRPGVAEPVACGACEAIFCSICKQQPYHYHCSCEQVMPTTRLWQDWLREGGEKYLQHISVHEASYASFLSEAKERRTQQHKLLREAEERLSELERMEEWKEHHCRHCPSCGRLVEKLDGCDLMHCGQNYHGGEVQNGCGEGFRWSEAAQYKRKLVDDPTYRKVHLATIQLGTDRPPPREELLVEWLTSTGDLVLCDACKLQLRGPKFTCLHCPDVFVVCHACVMDYTRLVPCEGASSSCLKGRLHRLDHVFRIAWNPAWEGMAVGLPFLSPQRLIPRYESKDLDDNSVFVASAAWCGPMRGYAFYRGQYGVGYYKQGPSREDTLRQQARALLLQISEEMRTQGDTDVKAEVGALARESGFLGLAEWSRCLFRFGIDLTNSEREVLRRVLDPDQVGHISVGDIANLLEGAEEVAVNNAHLLREVLAGGRLPPIDQEADEPDDLAKSESGESHAQSSASRNRARLLSQRRRQAGEDMFVCIGGTPLLKLRRHAQTWQHRLVTIARKQPVGEERVVRLIPGSATQPPALSWDLPQTEEMGASLALGPRRLLGTAVAHPFWKTKVLPLDLISALTYAPTRAASAAPDAIKAPSIDRARLFCLWTASGRGFDFMARSTSDCQAWVLTLGRILRARGVFARIRTRRAFVFRLVQVRIETQAEAYRMSSGELWMIALRRVAKGLQLPVREYKGRLGVCIACG